MEKKEEKKELTAGEVSRKRTIYDGVRISDKAMDTIVFVLSLALVIAISVGVLLSAKM